MTNAAVLSTTSPTDSRAPEASPASKVSGPSRFETSEGARPLDRTDLALAGTLGVAKLLIHLPVLTRYGYHHDELYFLACGQHADFGYVDHPPMVPWLAKAAHELFGQSLSLSFPWYLP